MTAASKKRSIRTKYSIWLLRRKCLTHGITVEYYVGMFMAQAGKCGICYTALSLATARIDHDHKTGVVRGLLCFHCNTGLGHFKDDRHLLYNAWLYLG
jgi:Autographiviridae endonuclease VII